MQLACPTYEFLESIFYNRTKFSQEIQNRNPIDENSVNWDCVMNDFILKEDNQMIICSHATSIIST